MALVGDAWIVGLVQTGPPPLTANDNARLIGMYKVNNLTELRQIATHPQNVRYMLFLLGQDAAYDGLLQGWYDYVPYGYHLDNADDNAFWIIVNDGDSAWRKVT